MRRKPIATLVEIDEHDIAAGGGASHPAIARAAAVLAGGGVLWLRITPGALEKAAAMVRARAALAAIATELRERHGLPPDAYVEVDEESHGTPVAPFRNGRFLLPHQDGGHCSFLTPSRLDCPELDSADRVFSSTVYWKRPSHKMFQGFIITNPGDPPGETYYYNALTLLSDAYLRRHHRAPEVSELAAFNLQNILNSRREQPRHGSRYLTLGGLLGSPAIEHHIMPSGPRAESELWPAQYMALPGLCELADRCPCGMCQEPGARLLCHTSTETLGRTWPEFRRDYEVCVVGERYDLLVGNNLTQLHAACSSVSRTIRPMCIVIDRPEGEPYERWLADQWRTWYSGTSGGQAA